MSSRAIDYDALARQAGAIESTKAVDYDALAAQAGAIPSADPLRRKITRAEDLPSLEEFDASHQAASQQLRGMLATPPPPRRNEGLARAPGYVEKPYDVLTQGPPVISEGIGPEIGRAVAGVLPEGKPREYFLGAGRGAVELMEGLASPMNVGLAVATGGAAPVGQMVAKVLPRAKKVFDLLPRAVSGYFSFDMLKHAVDTVPEVREAWAKGDDAEVARTLTLAAGSGALGTLAGIHAVKGGPKAAPRETVNKRAKNGQETGNARAAARVDYDALAKEAGAVERTPAATSAGEKQELRPAAAPQTADVAVDPKLAQNRKLNGMLTEQPEVTPGVTVESAPRGPKTPPAAGREIQIAIPGEQTRYPARYEVRELEDVQPSHNPQSFEPNPLYEILNDRDYKSNKEIAALVAERATPEKFDPDFLTADVPTAEHGGPIIDPRGNVLGGNSRRMTLGRVYDANAAEAQAYRRAIAEKAPAFGITEDLSRFKKPVLVRKALEVPDAQRAITDFNKGAPAKLAPQEQAVTDGRRMSRETVEELGARIGELSEDGGTLAEAIRGDRGAEVLNLLERDGVITAQEKSGLIDERGFLSPEAKGRIGKALVGRLFETPAQFRETTPAMRQKLERIAPQVLRVEGRPEWNLTERVREAVALVEDARAHRMSVEETARQGVMGEQPRRYHPEAIQIAEVLNENPRGVEYAFRRYASDEVLSREGAQRAFFEPPTREQAFRDAFGENIPIEAVPKAEQPIATVERQIEKIRLQAIADNAAKRADKAAARRATERRKATQRGAVEIDADELRKVAVRAREAYEGSPVRAAIEAIKPLGARIEGEGKGAGRALMAVIRRAGDVGEVEAGRKLVKLADANITKLDRAQRFELLDALEGRAAAPQAGPVREAFEAMRSITDELAMEAAGLGVEVQTRLGRRPFAALDNYFPHILRPPQALKRGRVRADIVENLVRRKIQPDAKAAEAFLDDWISYLETGKRQESILNHLVETGQAKDAAEALAKLQKKRLHIARSGSLEYSRELDLPFYDPDPVRVMPFTAAAGSRRLAQIAEFGQDHEVINREILKITLAGGNADFVRKSVDRIVGEVREPDTMEARASAALRAFSTLKLSLAQIPNATQTLNVLAAADVPALAYGLRRAMSKSGRRLAIESGAGAAETVMAEARRDLGGSRAIEFYLKGTGFTAVEQFNRATAANAGVSWARRNIKAARGEGKPAERARKALETLGVDVEAAIRSGQLSERDILMAAKRMSDMTQFRTRPEDLANLMTSSELGRMLFQFKSFAYNQARFLVEQTVGEMKSGNPGRGLRNLLIFAAVFPAAGDMVRLLRNAIQGRDQEFEDGLDRYAAGVAQGAGLGIMMDAFNAVEEGRTVQFLAGPTAGQVHDFGQLVKTLADDDKYSDEKLDAIKKYVLTRFGSATRRLWAEE